MPKIARELGALAVKNLKGEGMHPVGGVAGLYLNISDGGAKSWILRVSVGSKRREIGLGAHPEVTLVQARDKAREMREAIRQGANPISERTRRRQLLAEQQRRPTFRTCAQQYIESKRRGWKNAKHAQQWENTLATYAFPVIGDLLITEVKTSHVTTVLHPIWIAKAETADRVAGRIYQIWAWAKAMGYVSGDNPADRELLKNTLSERPLRKANKKHHPEVQVPHAGAFMRDLRRISGLGARALEFQALTGVRSGEVRGARWSEIDMARAEWVIPPGRMKATRTHRVPLSRQALQLLEKQPRVAGTDLVFPSARGGELSDMTLAKAMKSLHYRAADGRLSVPHGLRSTLRNWVEERTTGFSRSVKEAVLSHAVAENETEGAYLRTDLFDRRRPLMQQWANFLDVVEVDPRVPAEVVPLHQESAAAS